MSATARILCIIPALLVASWLAVRSHAASPVRIDQPRPGEMGDPPIPLASLSRELRDPVLAQYIGGLAAEARKN